MDHKFTNQLIYESSPYLLQHAHNPVNWYPWSAQALDKAQKENKLLIISIGYAACHWCHVMEHESFEDEEVAGYMNDHFVAVKVDREERPDIDQVYMNAVQLLNQRGGWPLNCIALPDGRPVYGGTYFTRSQWLDMLAQLTDFVKNHPDQAEQQATALTQGVQSAEMIRIITENSGFSIDDLHGIFNNWKSNLDYTKGGYKGAPKFPLPVGFQFLLQYHHMTRDPDAINAVTITLNKMAEGGIYDQIGGGFARYATDANWNIPHFEKMLYDNAQLVSLYSAAFQLTKNNTYKAVVTETLEFIRRELTSDEDGFYSSLDADSEGEEGKYYVWTKPALQKALGKNAEIIGDYYNITEKGNWENSLNILFKSANDDQILKKYNITDPILIKIISEAKPVLLKVRAERIRPGLDNKILTSWNALMLKAYADAYRVFGNDEFLDAALKNAGFIIARMRMADDRLFRNFKEGRASINGFLDDYAFTVDSFISLYQATFDENWLKWALRLTAYAIHHFYDGQTGMFYFTSDIDPPLIARKMEISDNVIPSSNGVMAKNLFALGHYFYNKDHISMARKMLNNVKQDAIKGGPYYAGWDMLMAWFTGEVYDVVIIGDGFKSKLKEFDTRYLPNVLLSGGSNEGTLPLLEGKLIEGQTTIYVCRNNTCLLPVTEVEDALKQISNQ